MRPIDIIKTKNPAQLLAMILSDIHKEGPVNQEVLERLAYLKKYYPDLVFEQEAKLMYLLGLFYKTTEPNDLLSLAYRIFQDSILNQYKSILTPVQSTIQNEIEERKFYSFSAPTSTGKSHILRELILRISEDIVIVLPSRALISEYLITVRKIVEGYKEILVLQFIDDINTIKTRKRVFIITPERGSDLFRYRERFNIGLFIFDEAQISEEGVRGLTFDAFVRRTERTFPNAKKVFVHPFVENPEAQLTKHGFTESASAQVFRQSAVGKIFIEFDKRSRSFSFFSPYIDEAHLKKNKCDVSQDIVKEVVEAGGSVLVYVSKMFIYNRKYREVFAEYIKLCPILKDPRALSIIADVERLIGATDHESELVSLMRRGIVIHHGSVPLVVRYLIESFANEHFARICFATSTLAQGVNIPFDIVWIDNLRFYGTEENKTLALKNLIGRAGRTTGKPNSFDFGYVVVTSIKTFIERFAGRMTLNEVSVLESDEKDFGPDFQEFITAVKEGTIDEDYSLPKTKVQRLRNPEIHETLSYILDFVFKDGQLITGDDYQKLQEEERKALKKAFAKVFETSLKRNLGEGEMSILSTAISILLWQIQGKSFKTLLGLRFSYLTKRSEQREINRRFRAGQINALQRQQELEKLKVKFSPIPTQLPNNGISNISSFGNVSVKDLNYDLLVYDTYDYLDKVISFSLSDIYVAAFDQYFSVTGDVRAAAFVNFIRYGTSNPIEILLIRYGFSPENVTELATHVESITEEAVVFRTSISEVEDAFDRYLIEHYR
ncbi:DEAD/DEAH box helicase [Geotalea sp. SG265]|uniref:DEAD/DEAH box helicase n=1 Tax=Geotalea sp. SG265 TaxID=2922867 RepID=UPI001FAF9EB9|nr:DEAD/DEAH box helicase [Geotalea sp. SG265]